MSFHFLTCEVGRQGKTRQVPGTLWGLDKQHPYPIPLPCTRREGQHGAAPEMRSQRPPRTLEGWLLSTERLIPDTPREPGQSCRVGHPEGLAHRPWNVLYAALQQVCLP